MRRVAFLLWPIPEEGGLATHAQALVALVRRQGWEGHFYRLHYSDEQHGKEDDLRVRASLSGLRLQGRHISVTDKYLQATLDHLDRYDTLVFVHPCPHKGHQARAVDNWRKLFTAPKGEKVVFFSDVYADLYYPWIEEVSEYFRPLCVNDAISNYLQETMGMTVPVMPHPFTELNTMGTYWKDREQLVLWTCAWRNWKGIKRFFRAVPRITAPVRLYGTGRELRQYRKEGALDDFPGEVMQARPPAEVTAAYQRAYASVDLTGQSAKYHGHYNRTTLEPMIHGCVSVTLPTLVEPYSRIPAECVWTVDKDAVAEGVNELLSKPEEADKIRETAYEWIRDTCNDDKVMEAVFATEVVR